MNFFTPHPFLDKAIDKALSILNSPLSERLIFLCGPSGVGKKEFIREITKSIIIAASPENPSCIPVVNVEATAPEQGSFNFANLWKQALTNLNEPLIDSKISYTIENRINSYGQAVPYSKMTKADYQEVLLNALNWRDVNAMIINESHHMLRVATGKKANWSIDLFKSLTNRSKTRIILVGTYELCTYLEDLDNVITDQINQRTKVIDLPRYHNSSAEEVNAFAKTAKKLLLHMPFEQTAENLVDSDWEYLYNYSLGCIGTLKNWFTDAYSLALDSNARTLTLDHLNETRIPGKRLSYMLDSIIAGEKRMATLLSDGDLKARLLSALLVKDEPPNIIKKDNTIKNSKPFERRPKRDFVSIR